MPVVLTVLRCQPCKQISPIFEGLSQTLSRPNLITFTKVDTETHKTLAQQYSVSALPTFVLFENGKEAGRVVGAKAANLRKMADRVKNIGEGGSASGEGSSVSRWLGAALPRGYGDVTDQIDIRGLDLLNADSEFGSVRTLFELGEPSQLGKGKSKASAEGSNGGKDWVESDTDPQLMLFMPFQSTLKVHTLHITSLPPTEADADDDEVPMRPRTVQLYTNRAHNLGFEEAEDIQTTQSFELKASDWDAETDTAKLELRFVKFQNVTSLVVFVVDGDGDGERTRIDRIRIIGESGEKRDMGKLEKIGDDAGE